MLHHIYIGRHADTIEQFSKIAEGAFYAIQNSRKASRLSIKCVKYDMVILPSSGSSQKASRNPISPERNFRVYRSR